MAKRLPTKDNLQPYGSRILVSPIEPEDTSKIYNPSEDKPKPQFGMVSKSGYGVPLKPEEGVVFGKFAGIEIDIEGEKFLIMKDSDILARY